MKKLFLILPLILLFSFVFESQDLNCNNNKKANSAIAKSPQDSATKKATKRKQPQRKFKKKKVCKKNGDKFVDKNGDGINDSRCKGMASPNCKKRGGTK